MPKPKVQIIIDSRETLPLTMPSRELETVIETLDTGDYGIRINGELQPIRLERKSDDVWTSFSGDAYRREREKIMRAKDVGADYMIVVDKTLSDLRKGHFYMKDGAWRQSKRDPLGLIRTLMTIRSKYGVGILFCNGAMELGFAVQEVLLAYVRGWSKETMTGDKP